MTEIVLWRRLIAEFAGSAFLTATVIGSGIAAVRLSPGNTGLELLENAAATAAGLYAIILMFGPVSAVTSTQWCHLSTPPLAGCGGAMRLRICLPSGRVDLGAIVANLMFGLTAASISTKSRASAGPTPV